MRHRTPDVLGPKIPDTAWRAALATALLSSFALAFQARAANLLPNGGFSTDLAGWDVVAPVTWSPEGERSPGAAVLQGEFGAIGVPALGACTAVQAGRLYDLSAVARVPYLPESVGGLSVRLYWHAGGCSASPLPGGGELDVTYRAPQTWQRVRAEGLVAPEGATSASVVVYARSGGKASQLYLDDVSLEAVTFASTLIVPTAADVAGAHGERFQSDLFVRNPTNRPRGFVLRLRCAVEVPCSSAAIVYSIGARETRVFPNVLGMEFNKRNFASAIEIEYDAGDGPLQAFSRASTRHPENPGNGMSVPARAQSEATDDALFLGLSGAEPKAGRRVNAGVMNPSDREITIAFSVHNGDGTLLGNVVTRKVAAGAWLQINDLFGAAGASLDTAVGAFATFAASVPVHPFVIAIDNLSGDPTWVPPVNDPQIR